MQLVARWLASVRYILIIPTKHPLFMATTQKRFVVFVDAGHGGINPQTNLYTTSGKRAYHAGLPLHDGKGNYYEGVENRIVAELFIDLLIKEGINFVRTYHPYEDSEDGGIAELKRRAALVNAYLKSGFNGYLHSFHSNAIGGANTPAKIEATTGFAVYTTVGTTFSDKIADQHWQHTQTAFPAWNVRRDRVDGDNDYEENFLILRDSNCPAILEEFGFHTSKQDVQFITSHRIERAKNALQTALWVSKNLK